MNTEKDKIIHGWYCENCIHDNHKDWRIFCQNCSKRIEYYCNQRREVNNFMSAENWINCCDYVYQNQIGNQTFEMSMRRYYETADTVYYYITLGVYNKRKHCNLNEDKKLITGLNPYATITEARKAFHILEQKILEAYNKYYNVVITADWADNQRRDVYYHFLSKYGYNYGVDLNKRKTIMKKYKKGEYKEVE